MSYLLDPQQRKILVESRDSKDGQVKLTPRQVTVRALYAELVASVQPSGQQGGGGRGGGCAVSAEALDLLDRIRATAEDWARLVGLPAAGESGDRCPRTLRRLVVHGWADVAQRDQLGRVVDRLAEQTAAFLAGDVTSQYVRDTRCPRCEAWDVREWSDEHAMTLRHPALHVVRHDARVQGTRCTACLTWWPWDGLGEDSQLAKEITVDVGRQTGRDAPSAAEVGVRCQCRSALAGCRCDRLADGPDLLCRECRESGRCGERRAWLAARC